jgi:CubicO group peptidase (beta-lactamase class C family)
MGEGGVRVNPTLYEVINIYMRQMKTTDYLMKKAVSEGVFPGAVLLVSKETDQVIFDAYGAARIDPERRMTRETVFDLASLTKPLATTLGVMILVQKGELFLEQEIGTIISAFHGTDKERVTIRQLLAHNSGLPDYRPYYKSLMTFVPERGKGGLEEMLLSERLIAAPGTQTVYSDIGFMILGWVMEVVTKTPLNLFIEETIYHPLGLQNLFFLPLDSEKLRSHIDFAATEECQWRKKVLEGEVHDDNAYAIGGVAGHTGLFGTAQDIHRLLVELLNAYHGRPNSGLFRPEMVHAFFKRQIGGRALGFDTPTRPGSSSGRYFSKHSVGHLGYTGTSFWIDLERSIIVILLTNRVHPSRENDQIKTFRPIIHDAIMEGLLEDGPLRP